MCGRTRSVEVLGVLDDPADQQSAPGQPGDLDGLCGALVRVDTAEDDQILAAGRRERQRGKVDPVVNGRCVLEFRDPVGIRDRDERRSPGLLRRHGRRAESPGWRNRGWWSPSAPRTARRNSAATSRCCCAPGRTRRIGAVHGRHAVPPRPCRPEPGSRRRAASHTPSSVGRGHRIAGGEQRHVDAQVDQTLGDQAGHLFPRAVVHRRGAPGDRRQHGDLHRRPTLERAPS